MTQATITPNLDAVICEIDIAAPPARVFEALTDVKQLTTWWGAEPTVSLKFWQIDPRLGGHWRMESSGCGQIEVNGVTNFESHGTIVEFDPPRALAYTWIANWHDNPSQETLVRWELAPTTSGTKVKVTHSGLSQLATARRDYSGGWPGVLELLKNFLN